MLQTRGVLFLGPATPILVANRLPTGMSTQFTKIGQRLSVFHDAYFWRQW